MQQYDTVGHRGKILALPSGSSALTGVRVQIPASAPTLIPAQLFSELENRAEGRVAGVLSLASSRAIAASSRSAFTVR